MEALDLIIGAIGLDSPSLGVIAGLTGEDFDLLPGIIVLDAPLFETIAGLSAEDFDIAPQPFEAIAVTPEIATAELELEILRQLYIPVESAIGGGHAIPLWQLLMPEEPKPQPAIDDESDDEEAMLTILLLAA